MQKWSVPGIMNHITIAIVLKNTKIEITWYIFFIIWNLSSLQGHHDHSFWAVHLIWGSVRRGEGHVLHGQRPALHHEVDRWGRYVFSSIFYYFSICTSRRPARIAGFFCLFVYKIKIKSRLYATSSSRLKHLEATGWFCQHLAVPCVKMSTCSKDHTQSCHLTVKTQFFLVSQERVHPPTQFLVVIYQLLRQQ